MKMLGLVIQVLERTFVLMMMTMMVAMVWNGPEGSGVKGKVVTQGMQEEMTAEIHSMIFSMHDSNHSRFMIPGIIRLCFHDCVVSCDGCIDMRRKVQSGNNGLEPVWKPLRKKWHNKFQDYCSLADFLALACVVTADYAAQRGEEERLCTRDVFQEKNDCRPNLDIVWGRRTCEHAQKVSPIREPPDADQDPYEWFKKNFQFTAQQAICIMGAHSLGRLRKNETGFEGNFTTRFDVLSNDYYKSMIEADHKWNQEKLVNLVDEKNVTRFQWNSTPGDLVRVNSDMMLLYKIKPAKTGVSPCQILPKEGKKKLCKQHENYALVEEVARDNKAFIACFGDAFNAMIQRGYEKGELVATGMEIPEPPTTATPEVSTEAQKVKPKSSRKAKKKTRKTKKNRSRRRKLTKTKTKQEATTNLFNINPFNRFFSANTQLIL